MDVAQDQAPLFNVVLCRLEQAAAAHRSDEAVLTALREPLSLCVRRRCRWGGCQNEITRLAWVLARPGGWILPARRACGEERLGKRRSREDRLREAC